MAKKSDNKISNYINIDQLKSFLFNDINDDGTPKITSSQFNNLVSTSTNGIEGIPYQFMETVDRRLPGTNVGRKYADKIFARMPLLFLTPCEPVFMDDFDEDEKKDMLRELLGGAASPSDFIEGRGRYYSVEFNYEEYYRYLNAMLGSVLIFLGLKDRKIHLSTTGNAKKMIDIDWSDELNSSFKSFFTSRENVIFFLDGLSSVSESFTNETMESSLAGVVNGLSDQLNELRFLFGKKDKNLASLITNGGQELASTLSSGLSSAGESLAGGILGSIMENSPMLKGGKIVFPKIWANSSFDRSYQLDIKLRSPDHDNLSIFLNVLKPYCKLLALTLPRAMDTKATAGKSLFRKGISDPNSYRSPFLVKAAAKGMFSIDMGIITSMSVTKGDKCCWNDDGLPTQIDISITIEDLYSALHMTGFGNTRDTIWNMFKDKDVIKGIVSNTAYMDFLANMSGINIAQQEPFRQAQMYLYLSRAHFMQTPNRLITGLDQAISRRIYQLWGL